jgi:hypothetical protein
MVFVLIALLIVVTNSSPLGGFPVAVSALGSNAVAIMRQLQGKG